MPQPLLFAVQELLQKYARPREAALLAEEALLRSRPQLPNPLGSVRAGVMASRQPSLPFADSAQPMFGTTAFGAPLPVRRNSRSAPLPASPDGAELDYVRQLVGDTDRGVQRFPRTQEGPWDTVAITERRIPGPPTEAGVGPTAEVATRLINKGDLFRAVDSRPGLFFSGQVEAPSDERLYAIGSGSERNPERRVNLPQSEQDVAYNRQPYTVARGGTMVDALIDGEPGYRQLPEETPLAVHRVIRNMIDSTLANGRTLKVPGAMSDVRFVTQYRGQPLPPDTVGLPVMRPGEIRSVSQPLAPLSGDPFGWNAEKQGPSWQRTLGRSSPDPHKWEGYKRGKGLAHQTETEGVRVTAVGTGFGPERVTGLQTPEATRLLLPAQVRARLQAGDADLLKIPGLTAPQAKVAGMLAPLLRRAQDNADPDWTMADYNQLRDFVSKRAEREGTPMALAALDQARESYGIPLSPRDEPGFPERKTWDQKENDKFAYQALNLDPEKRLIPTLGGVDTIEAENTGRLPGVSPDAYTAIAKGQQDSLLLPHAEIHERGIKPGDTIFLDNEQEQLELRVLSIGRPEQLAAQDRIEDRVLGLRLGLTAGAVRTAVDAAPSPLSEIRFERLGTSPTHVTLGARSVPVNDLEAAKWAEGFAPDTDFRKAVNAALPQTGRWFNEAHYADVQAGRRRPLPPALQPYTEAFLDFPNIKIQSPKPGYRYAVVNPTTGDAYWVNHFLDGTQGSQTKIQAPQAKKGQPSRPMLGVEVLLDQLARGSDTGNRTQDKKRLTDILHEVTVRSHQRGRA